MNVCLFCNILCSIIPFFLSQFSTNMTVVWFVGFTILRCLVLYTQYFLLFDSYFTNTLSVFFRPVLVTFQEYVTWAYHLRKHEVSTAKVKSFSPTESKDSRLWSTGKRGSGTNPYGMCWLESIWHFISRSCPGTKQLDRKVRKLESSSFRQPF